MSESVVSTKVCAYAIAVAGALKVAQAAVLVTTMDSLTSPRSWLITSPADAAATASAVAVVESAAVFSMVRGCGSSPNTMPTSDKVAMAPTTEIVRLVRE